MAISAVHRRSWTRSDAWLVENWPAALWLAAAVAVTVAGALAFPESFHRAADLADMAPDQRDELRRALASLHLTPTKLAGFQSFTNAFSIVVNLTVGWLLIRRGPRTWFTGALAFVFLGLSAANYPPDIDDVLPGRPIAQLVIRLATFAAVTGFMTLPFLFPDGRVVPRWTRPIVVYIAMSVGAFVFFPDIGDAPWWTPIDTIFTVVQVLSTLFAVVYRYRRVSTTTQRQQTRWVVFGLLVAIPGFMAGDAMMRSIDGSPSGVACLFGFLIVMPIAFGLPTVTIGIAILNHRLFDIDVVLSRTLVWLAMTAAVVGAYVGLVLGVGGLVGSDDSLLLSLLATGLVAVAFQPARARVQRTVDRLLFGDRDDPYAVLARLGHRIEDSLSTSELLPAIVRTTQEALRLPYAALFLERPGGPVLAAASGFAPAAGASPTVRLPMVYQGQTVGTLEVATRGPGERFGAADRRLLEDLARQVGVAARTVNLATDLQHSRERIVIAREEERRRLRRDLHDGLGAQLAALILQAGAIRPLFRVDPDAADREIADLRDELRAAVADIRRLVAGLRPPALDELGLAAALRERLARLDRPDARLDRPDARLDRPDAGPDVGPDVPGLRVRFAVDDPLPPLPAAAEVAAFRIVEEAVTNVVRHAAARTVDVTLRVRDGTLAITVADDGVGLAHLAEDLDMQADAPTVSEPWGGSGLGLQSMRERATELGGACLVTPNPAGPGTLVSVTLPLTETATAPVPVPVGESTTGSLVSPSTRFDAHSAAETDSLGSMATMNDSRTVVATATNISTSTMVEGRPVSGMASPDASSTAIDARGLAGTDSLGPPPTVVAARSVVVGEPLAGSRSPRPSPARSDA